MHAEIVAIGTELMTGAKLDTNSQWLSQQLLAVGIPVVCHTTVGDDLAATIELLRTAANRSDVVLITGGLGPTQDDLTREALAALSGSELVLHEPSLQTIRDMFAKYGRTMPERNVVQAMYPAAGEPISNPVGTAPGVWLSIERPHRAPALFAAMPGVPSEMKRMFHEQVLPRLPIGGASVIRQASIHTFGAGESAVEEMLGDLTARGHDPDVGITAHEATITLRITAAGRSVDECETKIAATRSEIRERLGSLVFGEDATELEHVAVELLQGRSATLATIEAGTGGLLARWLSAAPGSSTCYSGGIVAPAPAPSVLGIDLFDGGELRQAAARAVASCRERFGADFGLAVIVAGQGQAGHVPQAAAAIIGENLQRSAEATMPGDPAIVQSRAAKMALNLLRLHLERA